MSTVADPAGLRSSPRVTRGGVGRGPAGQGAPAEPSLRVAEYANPVVHARERSQLFLPGRGLLYLDHDVRLGEVGVRRADGDPRLLVSRDAGRSRALANLCTHALRPLLDDDEPVERSLITCPFHQWSYRRDGSFVGGPGCSFAPGAAGDEERSRLDLREFPVVEWNGLLFAVEEPRRAELTADLAALERSLRAHGVDPAFGDDWVLHSSADDVHHADWKIFMEVFGDCYHVPPFHDGLAAFADCSSLEWEFGEHFHVQYLDFAAEAGAPSQHYAGWAQGLAQDAIARGEDLHDLAVAWVALYPNLMLEYYAGLRVLSVVIPTGPSSFVNRAHFFVRRDTERLVPGLTDTMFAAYRETAVQDDALVATRARGIATARSLDLDNAGYLVQTEGTGPEAGVAHFHDWWRREMRAR